MHSTYSVRITPGGAGQVYLCGIYMERIGTEWSLNIRVIGDDTFVRTAYWGNPWSGGNILLWAGAAVGWGRRDGVWGPLGKG